MNKNINIQTNECRLLSEDQLSHLLSILNNTKKAVVCCHRSPDGDAIGSLLAWNAFLLTKGIETIMIVPDAYPDFLGWLPCQERIVRFDKHADKCKVALSEADVMFCLDFNTTSRLGDDLCAAVKESGIKKVLIDHHLTPDSDLLLSISHPEMSSTAEMLFWIIRQLNGDTAFTKQIATCLYCGMMTDTGNFTYSSDRPEIYTAIGILLSAGINKDKISRNVYNNYSHWAMRLRGHIICQKMNVIEDAHATFFAVSKEEMERYHFIKGDLEGLVNEPLRIKGIKLSISLREDDRQTNLVWVSLRSVGNFSCKEMAEQCYGGGGHENASGGNFHGTLDEAVAYTRNCIEIYKDKLIAASK